MKESLGTSHPCPALKFLSDKVGSMLCRCNSPNKYKRLDAKLERKMIEVKRGVSGHNNFRSINSIIMRFPQFKEELKNIRVVFEQYEEMDWKRNGKVSFREFLFALIDWVGIDTDDEIPISGA
ncbi:hypothetical protein L1049_016934 [Liquidambar formosana]|uniref:EF-hand domain-containing protein n=1 Tax=Liquidambar formosana TaxID=63359 RepID=A0AAP0S0Y0_LIQFO